MRPRAVTRSLLLLALLTVGCARAAAPLRGELAPDRRLPALAIAPGHRHIVFRWEYEEGEIAARGEGSFRVAAPDSVRLDFFLGGGLGAGGAVLIGNELRSARQDMVRRYLPPTPLMWAVFNRLAIPSLPDTVIRTEGDILRGDVGRPAEWRVTTRGDSLIGLEHISGSRIAESLTKSSAGTILYEAPGARRKLRLTIVRQQEVGPFDASIWSL